MSELGQWLQEARQAKELSLEQVEAQIRIRCQYLTALEEGNYDDLPAEIFTKGFLRNYALFLGLDPAEALEKYAARETVSQGRESSLFRPLEIALFRATDGRLRSLLLLLILTVALLTAGLWAWWTGRLIWPPPSTLFQPTATSTVTPRPSHTPTPVSLLPTTATKGATATPEATATSAPSPTLTANTPLEPTPTAAAPTPTTEPPAPTATQTQAIAQPTVAPTSEPITPSVTLAPGVGVTVSISVAEECWTEVTLDNLNDYRGLLEAGEQRTWQAQHEIILRLGNAGGVEVTANGEFLGALGERQQVVEFAWGPEGEVTPQPTATSEATVEPTETLSP